MRARLPNVKHLGIHPLFGPQSAKKSWRNHKLVVCTNVPSSAKVLMEFFENQGLVAIKMSAEDHDRDMAVVQSLTHFIARALSEMGGVKKSTVATSAFMQLCKMLELLTLDSWELFETLQTGNTFAAPVRASFMRKLREIEDKIRPTLISDSGRGIY
jgi:prephenate dehydrogenase